MGSGRTQRKRQTDLEIISEWIDEGSRVLDLGCGRGIFLEHLKNRRGIRGVGVDINVDKISSCVKRGVTAYQGDALAFMDVFDDKHFDWVVCSRTLQEMSEPGLLLEKALRVGRNVAVGFANYAYWKNRVHWLLHGSRPRNKVFTQEWAESRADVPISIGIFENYCAAKEIEICQRVYLKSDWKTPLQQLPNLRTGYAIYSLRKQ
ncbi:MAG: methyltransferase domain-containing protein [Opitutales bacterium]|nr:methyltransferase domain-containing protein [Opitutales bacterium]